MKKHIPNLITCMNVVSGTLAIFMAMYGQLMAAAGLILLAMVFDFFDGMAARALHVKSDMGKELDSLADMVSFGVAPALLAYFLMTDAMPGYHFSLLKDLPWYWVVALLCPLVIPAFSAFRLAKFNLDPRQTTSFIGMPTPANALFWIGLVLGKNWAPELYAALFGNVWVLGLCALILSVLLISELPMFSLKISSLGWRTNKGLYILVTASLLTACFVGKSVVIFIIPFYILINAIEALGKAVTSSDR